jgi:hypothetical protein
VEYVDNTDAPDAGGEAGAIVRAHIEANPSDPTCTYLSNMIHVASIVGPDLAGLVTIGALAMLRNRIPGALSALDAVAAVGGSNVKA